MVGALYPPLGQARLYRHVGLWLDGVHRCNLVLATVKGAKESWAVITDESPTLQTLWQYALRLQVEELFLDSKSGAFEERRFTTAISSGPRTFVSDRSHCHSVCHNSGYGGATSRLTATGRPALATRYQLPQNRLEVAIAAFSIKDENCWLPFHFFPKTRSPVLPLSRLSKISMSKFCSPASVL